MLKKIQLKNGLNVILYPSNKSPVISVQMWVRTGSADEKISEAGISHFIEHLVFKGTDEYGVGEIAKTVEGSGGELNAYTSFDQTVFYVTISKAFSDIGLSVISQMMGFPKFDSAEIDNEREVVIEEIKRGNDSPQRRASQLMFSQAFRKHPYGIPVIGYDKIIKKISTKKIKNYYNSRYVPANMTLVIVGDFELKNMKTKVESYFSNIKPNKLIKVKRTKEPAQKNPKIKFEEVPFEETILNFAWKAPSVKHADVPALDVLALILGQGDSSRLIQALRINKNLVNYIGSSSYTPLDPGVFVVSLSCNQEKITQVLEELYFELDKFLNEYVTSEELAKAVINLSSEEIYSLETVDGLARKFGSYQHYFNDPSYFEKYVKQISTLTPIQLLKVARKYLVPSTLTVTGTAQKNVKNLEKELKNWVKKFGKLKTNRKVKEVKKFKPAKALKLKAKLTNKTIELKRRQVVGGLLLSRPSDQAPIVNFRCGFRGGIRQENKEKSGLTELLSRTWATSTMQLDEISMYKKLELMAGSLSSFGGRNTIGLNLHSLSPFLKKSLDLWDQVLTTPKFEESIIEREKEVMIEQQKMRNDNPAQVCILNFMKSMYGTHPYSLDPLGTEESIKAITRNDLIDYYEKIVCRENFTGAIGGSFDENHFDGFLSDTLNKLPKGNKVRDHFDWHKPMSQLNIYKEISKEQSHIVVGFPGLNIDDSQKYVLSLMQSILAGQGGRLFLELRDKASLAYSVSPLKMEGVDAGYFGAYIGCSPEKGSKAISMMFDEFKKISDHLVSEEELLRSKRYLIGRHDIDLQKTSSIISSILFDEVYDVDSNENFIFSELINKITPEDIMGLAQKIFSQPPVMSAVGKTCPW